MGVTHWEQKSWSSRKQEVRGDFNLRELPRVSTIPSRLSQSLANLSV